MGSRRKRACAHTKVARSSALLFGARSVWIISAARNPSGLGPARTPTARPAQSALSGLGGGNSLRWRVGALSRLDDFMTSPANRYPLVSMTRRQRRSSAESTARSAANDAFIARPHTLSPPQVLNVLGVLCVRLGYCLAPAEQEAVAAHPPTNPRAFAQLVIELDGPAPFSLDDIARFTGGAIYDDDTFLPIYEIVLAAFRGAANP